MAVPFPDSLRFSTRMSGGCCLLFAIWLCLFGRVLPAAEWSIPLAGNAYRTYPGPGGNGIRSNEGVIWRDANEVYSVYFYVDRAASLTLSAAFAPTAGTATIQAEIAGEQFASQLAEDTSQAEIGTAQIDKAGYVRVDLKLKDWSASKSPTLQSLKIQSDTANLSLTYVKSNEGNMFYWGRRGPSVHLSYQTPEGVALKYAYNELTIPEGEDPIGSYFMAIGFAEGYFGIQVNSETERRVLFSVWSPFQTDDPKSIPEDQRIQVAGRGEGVTIGEFGNEGSGGQSYLVYPWQAGKSYRFLLEVVPLGNDQTQYTAWMSEVGAERWKLIASFRRPKTDTTLKRFHSFLENFNPAYGHVARRVLYENVWVSAVDGKWYPCNAARFSVDATGGGGHRLDFTGGASGEQFFLKNCGFFSEAVAPGTIFTIEQNGMQPPPIELGSLPR